MKKKEGIY